MTVNSAYVLAVLPNSKSPTLPYGYVRVPYNARIGLTQRVGGGTWMTRNIPTWLNFNPSTQIISGTPP